jgi:hypothetical protein
MKSIHVLLCVLFLHSAAHGMKLPIFDLLSFHAQKPVQAVQPTSALKAPHPLITVASLAEFTRVQEKSNINAPRLVQEEEPAQDDHLTQERAPDWQGTYKQLLNAHQDLLNRRLEDYKNTDITQKPWNMDASVSAGRAITKQDDVTLKSVICATCDAVGNTFSHYAVEQGDKLTVEWCLSSAPDECCFAEREDGQTPFELCVNKLSPQVPYATRVITRAIFDTMFAHIASTNTYSHRKERCVSSALDGACQNLEIYLQGELDTEELQIFCSCVHLLLDCAESLAKKRGPTVGTLVPCDAQLKRLDGNPKPNSMVIVKQGDMYQWCLVRSDLQGYAGVVIKQWDAEKCSQGHGIIVPVDSLYELQ